ncbi:MAG TPA: cupin domain-containing protein [Pseudomonadales bacterium]|nr:cupin domain-containing protein [Pseudomonadales bacterium]
MKHPIHASELTFETWYAGTDREIRGQALGDFEGVSKVGVGLLELPPGSNTKPAHWHTKEEEHLYVLSGRATLHLGARQFELRAGSFVCFPAGQAEAHYIDNTGTEACTYLIVGERIGDDEVVYPSGS